MGTPRDRSNFRPFFHTPPRTENGSLAVLHLKRDSLMPVFLRDGATDDGYAEGAVTNTRFGSFPHSTLINLEWGAQVRASRVDTGGRGRKNKEKASKKRNSEEAGLDQTAGEGIMGTDQKPSSVKAPMEAGSGFVHILPPTPETWTSSLDHRTQVVYTPDSSYILHRLGVRPGSTMLEAGAGSGSFTHAAARSVYDGTSRAARGQVYSFEYHQPRAEALREELEQHGLDDVVTLTHRDVCKEGFQLADRTTPRVDAAFLDLPAPWQALKWLVESQTTTPIRLCTFSPCIEQVMATVSAMRKSGWVEIEMVEVQNRRIDVRREQIGYRNEGLRGVNASAASVEEAIGRLREVEQKLVDFHTGRTKEGGEEVDRTQSKQARLEQIKIDAKGRQLFKEGNLIHRTEPEVKTHTSYLVFAILPGKWTAKEDLQ